MKITLVQPLTQPVRSVMMMIMMIMMMNCFRGMIDRRKVFSLYSVGTNVRDSQHRKSLTRQKKIWTCAEPEFRLCWRKLCSSDNHYTTAPQSFIWCFIWIITWIFSYYMFLCTVIRCFITHFTLYTSKSNNKSKE